eukprot:144784_1
MAYNKLIVVPNPQKQAKFKQYFIREKEFEFQRFLKANPNYYSEQDRYAVDNPIHIFSWQEYANQSSLNGRVEYHFERISMGVKDHAVSTSENCIHHKFKNVSECVEKLFQVLYGNLINFKKFVQHHLCYDCLLLFCSKKKK